MGWGGVAKSGNNGKNGKGSNKSKGGGGGGAAGRGSHAGIARSGKGNGDQQYKAEVAKMVAEHFAELAKQAKSKEAAAAKKYWLCVHCGKDRCFTPRSECHKRLKPKVQQPPGLPAAAVIAAAMPAATAAPAARRPWRSKPVPPWTSRWRSSRTC